MCLPIQGSMICILQEGEVSVRVLDIHSRTERTYFTYLLTCLILSYLCNYPLSICAFFLKKRGI